MTAGVRTSTEVLVEPVPVPSRAGYGTSLLAYAIALPVLLLLAPAVLKGESGLAAGFTWQEVADLLTPIVILPLFALALVRGGGMDARALFAFTAIAGVWISGQAMHLAANAIGDATVDSGATAYLTSVPGELGEWLDEVLSHWVWHAGWVALLLLLAWSTLPSASVGGDSPDRTGVALVAGGLQGFTWFVVTVEGVTAVLGIPAAVVYVWLGLRTRRSPGSGRVTAAFLLATGAVSIVGYAVWAAFNGGALPEFSHWVAPS